MLRNRTLVAANLTGLLAFGAFFSFIFLGSLPMQQELGYSAAHTGLTLLAVGMVWLTRVPADGDYLTAMRPP